MQKGGAEHAHLQVSAVFEASLQGKDHLALRYWRATGGEAGTLLLPYCSCSCLSL